MYKIREIKYAPHSTSIQVYKIENRKRVIVRHIGTARNDQEKADLLTLANEFIQKTSKQLDLFPEHTTDTIFYIHQTGFIGVYYSFLYELLSKYILTIGLDKIKSSLLLDLVILRLMEPASKLRSIDLLEEYFGIKHRRQNYYRSAAGWLDLKSKAEAIALDFAVKHYAFKYDLLFYDVTTLYFESFEEDELRKNGFSKDNKSQQPQILVALMVTKEGFPIAYEVFAGNTFEGHTLIPVVKAFIRKSKIKELTVVADAAMISSENIQALKENGIHYIVGARLGNVSSDLMDKIDQTLPREEGQSIRLQTNSGYLICNYSSVRYRKDKHEMDKQIQKAKDIISHPSKSKRLKFTKINGQQIELHQKLIDKTQRMLGIKGYYTDLDPGLADNKTIIDRYHELYKIEHAFRISKSDLQTRPIFHYKEEPIKLHLLICFMALVVSRHIELQTGFSIKNVIHECKKITDARLKNRITGTETRIRADVTPSVIEILEKSNLLT